VAAIPSIATATMAVQAAVSNPAVATVTSIVRKTKIAK
jgi:hypothetical protein